MKHFAKLNALFISAACSAISAPTLAGSITAGDFSTWSFGATGTVSVTREASAGNPAERLNITTISGPIVYGTAIKSDYSLNP